MKFLLAVVVVNLFIFFLCLLIEMSYKILKKQGQAKLKVNSQKEVVVDIGKTLLETLADSQIYLPAACGGKGSCGECRLKALSGLSPINAIEESTLSNNLIKGGYRLACQAKVRLDVELEISESILNIKKYPLRVEKIEVLTPDIKLIEFSCDYAESVEFIAGQYFQFSYQLPYENIVRAYSASSFTKTCSGFSFTIDVQRIDFGIMSNYLHSLKPKDILFCTGPHGEMLLNQECLNRDLVFIGGGVGLAPIRCMIEAAKTFSADKSIKLFHGARNRSALYFEPYFNKLSGKYKKFEYFPVLSEPLLQDGWTGPIGFLHQVLEKQLANKSNAVFFICGPSLMIEACLAVLFDKGIDSANIKYDPFDSKSDE